MFTPSFFASRFPLTLIWAVLGIDGGFVPCRFLPSPKTSRLSQMHLLIVQSTACSKSASSVPSDLRDESSPGPHSAPPMIMFLLGMLARPPGRCLASCVVCV